MTTTLGHIYLPANPGTAVGRFTFLVDADHDTGRAVEVGTPVAADTDEGVVIGAVVDMRTVGTQTDPVAADLAGTQLARLGDVVVADVQVLHSERMRPVRSGTVRAATAAEMLQATGAHRMDWGIPAGVVSLADGSIAPVQLDGNALLGPESAHLTVGGLSGQAAKTSYIGTLLASAINAGGGQDQSVAALIFNVKGEDLVYLDQPPAAGYELTDEDVAIYQALGLTPEPFADVTVYAPALPAATTGTRSSRPDALRIGWDLPLMWPYLKHFLGPVVFEDEKVASFLAEFETLCLRSTDQLSRVDTFDKLDAWFQARLREAEETDSQYAWRTHHKATMWRIRRMLMGLPSRAGGLLLPGQSRTGEDIPDTGWTHGQVIVVDIAGLQTPVQSVVIARTIERMLRSAEHGELGVDHLVTVTDELNDFAPAQGSEMATVRKILQRTATQGRYAGISLWGAGQKLSKIDELVRDNAATRALGITADGELASGVYGRMPSGLTERIATLPKGQMALSHYSFRSTLIVRFPRPAWRTGKAKTTGASKPTITSGLGISAQAVGRLTEGLDAQIVEQTVAGAADPDEAIAKLQQARTPDMSKAVVHEPSGFDPDNPFELD